MARSEEAALVPEVGERDRISGPAGAPATLVEFGDYDCPYTVRAHSVVRGLQRRMGDDLRFVFRVFPLTQIHEHAQIAAEAAEAAAAQGSFWQMHDRLFEAHRKLVHDDLLRYAEEIGLDVGRFERDLSGQSGKARIREDVESGVRSGIGGTPTFFVGGVLHEGDYDLDTLLAALQNTAQQGGER